MKIAHINLSDSKGGAANAVIRLHQAMLDKGIDSDVYVVRSDNEQDDKIVSPKRFEKEVTSKIRYVITRQLSRGYDKSRGLFSANYGSSSVVNPRNFTHYDAIYIHWINHGMMSLKSLEKILKLNRPVFWVCHDTWPLTGGCHLNLDCKKLFDQCGSCPSLFSTKDNDMANKLFIKKKRLYAKYPNLHFIAISPYMNDLIRNSAVAKEQPIHLISNAINTTLFKPLDKMSCREKFNLPATKKLILFGADRGLKNLHKGWDFVHPTIEQICKKNPDQIELVVFGSEYQQEIASLFSSKVHFVGTITQSETMAMLYNACDVYLNPSVAESLSYTTMESISCGTPCAAFRVGGIPYVLTDGISGKLADVGNIKQLQEAVEWCLERCSDPLLSENCVGTIKGKFDLDTIAQKHIELLTNMVHCGI